jgi:hypothetical protein
MNFTSSLLLSFAMFGTMHACIIIYLIDRSSKINKWCFAWIQGLNFIAAIAVEGEQNAVDHCGNDGNFLSYSIIFILFTVHYYFDTWIQMLIKSSVNHNFSLSFLREKTLKKYVNMFLACQQSKVTIKLNFYYSHLKKCPGNWQNCRRQLLRSTAIFNAIAVDWFQGNSRPTWIPIGT